MVTVTTGPKKKKPAQPPLEEIGECSSLWPPSKALDCLESIKKIVPSSGPASSPAAQGCGSKPPLNMNNEAAPDYYKKLAYNDPRRVKYRAWYKCKQGS